MGLKHALLSLTPTTGLQLPFGVGMLGPSGIHGRTFARRIRSAHHLAEKIARWQVHPTVAPEIAQQVVEEVYWRITEDGTFLDGREKIPPIIFGMVQNILRDRKRGMARRSVREAVHMEERAKSVHVWMDPASRLSEAETEEVDRRALERLTQAEREVLAFHEAGLSYRDIAKRRGTTVSTVRGQTVKARAVYREECLKAEIPAPPPKDTAKRQPKPSASPNGGADEPS